MPPARRLRASGNVRVRIAAVGSPFGDDRLGWIAAGRLRRSAALVALPAGVVSIAELDRPGADLLRDLEGLSALYVIDAMRTGGPPGTLHTLHAEAATVPQGALSSHGLGVAAALALGEAMACLPPRVIVFGLEITSTSGTGLAPEVEAALPGLVAAVEHAVLGEVCSR